MSNDLTKDLIEQTILRDYHNFLPGNRCGYLQSANDLQVALYALSRNIVILYIYIYMRERNTFKAWLFLNATFQRTKLFFYRGVQYR